MQNLGYIEKFVANLGSSYTDDLLACVVSAYRAGSTIAGRDFSQDIAEKEDEHVQHHAVISEADMLAQEIVFDEFGKYFPDAFLIGEEADTKNPRFERFYGKILTESNYLDSIPSGKVVIADPLDGTAQYAMLTGNWSVSVGILDKMKHTAAAVYGPKCNYHETGSGLLVFAAADTPAFKVTDKGVEESRAAQQAEPKRRFVYYGADAPFLSPHGFMKGYVNSAWTGNMHGSCALGMALVAAGDSHLFYQPEQRVWDWAAGKLLVEKSEGHAIFYEVGNKLREMGMEANFAVRRIEDFQPYHYNPAKKPLGFLAAYSREVAEEEFARLEKAFEKHKSLENMLKHLKMEDLTL